MQKIWQRTKAAAGYAAAPIAMVGVNIGVARQGEHDQHFNEVVPFNAGVVSGELAAVAIGAAFDKWGTKLPDQLQQNKLQRRVARVLGSLVGMTAGAIEGAWRDGRWISGAFAGTVGGFTAAGLTSRFVPNWGQDQNGHSPAPTPEAGKSDTTAPELVSVPAPRA